MRFYYSHIENPKVHTTIYCTYRRGKLYTYEEYVYYPDKCEMKIYNVLELSNGDVKTHILPPKSNAEIIEWLRVKYSIVFEF